MSYSCSVLYFLPRGRIKTVQLLGEKTLAILHTTIFLADRYLPHPLLLLRGDFSILPSLNDFCVLIHYLSFLPFLYQFILFYINFAI